MVERRGRELHRETETKDCGRKRWRRQFSKPTSSAVSWFAKVYSDISSAEGVCLPGGSGNMLDSYVSLKLPRGWGFILM